MNDQAYWVDSTPDVSYGEEHKADQAAIERQLANPNACLKHIWEHLEVMEIARTTKTLSLWTVAMALITIIHGRD